MQLQIDFYTDEKAAEIALNDNGSNTSKDDEDYEFSHLCGVYRAGGSGEKGQILIFDKTPDHNVTSTFPSS